MIRSTHGHILYKTYSEKRYTSLKILDSRNDREALIRRIMKKKDSGFKRSWLILWRKQFKKQQRGDPWSGN